jgi:hypothetical protein
LKNAFPAMVISALLISPVLAQNNQGGGGNQGNQGNQGGGGMRGAPGPVLGAGLPVLAVGAGIYWVVWRRKKAASKA